jgi:hypothetical protein
VVAVALAITLVVLVVSDQRAAARAESAEPATSAARKAVPALLSYKPDTVVSDLEAEKNLVTGTFAYDYRRLVTDVVGTTSADATDPRLSGSRLKVTMKRVEDSWRISGLDAV